MKSPALKKTLMALLAVLFLPLTALAQVTADAGFPAAHELRTLEDKHMSLADRYRRAPLEYRDWAWWKALQEEIGLEDVKYSSVTPTQLREIIFFSNGHEDKVDLRPSAEAVYNVYRFHEEEPIRLLALTALHAIGENTTMYRLYTDLEYEHSDRIRRAAIAALNDHYGRRAEVKSDQVH